MRFSFFLGALGCASLLVFVGKLQGETAFRCLDLTGFFLFFPLLLKRFLRKFFPTFFQDLNEGSLWAWLCAGLLFFVLCWFSLGSSSSILRVFPLGRGWLPRELIWGWFLFEFYLFWKGSFLGLPLKRIFHFLKKEVAAFCLVSCFSVTLVLWRKESLEFLDPLFLKSLARIAFLRLQGWAVEPISFFSWKDGQAFRTAALVNLLEVHPFFFCSTGWIILFWAGMFYGFQFFFSILKYQKKEKGEWIFFLSLALSVGLSLSLFSPFFKTFWVKEALPSEIEEGELDRMAQALFAIEFRIPGLEKKKTGVILSFDLQKKWHELYPQLPLSDLVLAFSGMHFMEGSFEEGKLLHHCDCARRRGLSRILFLQSYLKGSFFFSVQKIDCLTSGLPPSRFIQVFLQDSLRLLLVPSKREAKGWLVFVWHLFSLGKRFFERL